MAFELFVRSRGGAPTVKFAIKGYAKFNSGCLKQYMEPFGYANVYYDAENKLIGFQLLKEKSDNAILISKSPSSGTMSLIYFIREYDLEYLQELSLPVEWSDEHGMLIVKIPEKEVEK